MRDERIALTDERYGITKLTAGGSVFFLDSEKSVGRGGTCLVYHARKQDSQGIGRRVMLKEFYPLLSESEGIRIHRREDGSVEIPQDLAAYSEEYRIKRKRFIESYEMFKAFFNEEATNNYTVQGQELLGADMPVNGTMYMVVDYNDGMTLYEYMDKNPSLYDFLQVVKKTALVLEELHQLGYLHLDLSPGNILYMKDGYIKLMDTDSFVAKTAFLQSDPVCLSLSDGYAAPEVIRYEDTNFMDRQRFARRGSAADVFSIGAILYRYLYGESLSLLSEGYLGIDLVREEELLEKRVYEETLEEQIWKKYPDASRRAVSLLRNLLRDTLTSTTSDRLLGMTGVIRRIEEILPYVKPEEVRLMDNFRYSPYPVYGREKQVQEIWDKLERQRKQTTRIVCICGMGGIGKSTLAKNYARTYGADYDVILEVSALEAKEAIGQIGLTCWKDDLDPEPAPEEAWQRKTKKIKDLMAGQRTLLIVHDYNVSEDSGFSLWRELPCDILLTSWNDWSKSGLETVLLKTEDLSEEKSPEIARTIFREYYLHGVKESGDTIGEQTLSAVLEQETEAVDALVRQLNYHPLGIKLLAKQLTCITGGEIFPSEAVRFFRQSGTWVDERLVFPEDHENQILEQNVYGHLGRTFLTMLRQTKWEPEEWEALRYMILVSPNYGISIRRFTQCTGLEGIWLERLRRRGWLEYRPGQKDLLETAETGRENSGRRGYGVYHMPMILAETLSGEEGMRSNLQNSRRFVEQIMLPVGLFASYSGRSALFAAQETLLRYLQEEYSPAYADLLLRISHTLHEVDGSALAGKQCIGWYEKALNIYETLEADGDVLEKQRMQICNNIAAVAYEMGDLEQCISYTEKALRIQEENQYPHTETSLLSQMNLGVICFEQGKLEEAERYLLEVCEQFQKIPQESAERWTAHGFSHLGYLYYRIGEWDYAEKCLALSAVQFGNWGEDENWARSLRNMGAFYLDREDFERSRECFEKAYEVRKKRLGEDHVLSLLTLSDLADLHVRQGKTAEALALHQTVYESMSRQAEPDIRRLAKALLDVALDYREMGNQEGQWQSYLSLACEQYTRCIEKPIRTLEDILDVYIDTGTANLRQGNQEKGLWYYEESQKLRRRMWGGNEELAQEYLVLSELFLNHGYTGRGKLWRARAKQVRNALDL